ncbi:MAG: DNA/pantothenate metabolism flavoprotein domain protein [Verrucomicrobiales bacterium]|nr:DNA/pantothenate metabolism flavoprotein domain protein [Verrucomicrobiales bacterium]
MRCLVTAGPTWEPLDRVRRLTNFSTGSLGGDLANALASAGHDVVLFLSESATWRQPLSAIRVESFNTTESLAAGLRSCADPDPVAIFHAAAVGDYQAGSLRIVAPDGTVTTVHAGKVDSRGGTILVELVPTPKILPQLPEWFPRGRITGWKYEVDGSPNDAVARGERQLESAGTHACVVNGPAWGTGFAWLRRGLPLVRIPSRRMLLDALVSAV